MQSLELLKLFSTKSSMLTDQRGGVPSITPVDVACYCSGLYRPSYLLALRVICDYQEVERELLHSLAIICSDLSAKQGWFTSKQQASLKTELFDWIKKGIFPSEKSSAGRIIGLVRGALWSFMNNNLCKKCRGTGMSATGIKCTRCNGEGHLAFPHSKLARQCGIPRKTFTDSWQPRFSALSDILDSLWFKAVEHFDHKLNAFNTDRVK